jgi:allophanate hydrolase subunit 1
MKKYLVIGLGLLFVAGFAFAGGGQEPSQPAGKVVTDEGLRTANGY